MKNLKLLFTTVIMLILLVGCQTESDIIKLPPPADAFDAESSAANYIKRAALRDGSYDNIIDGTSCSSVVLPVTVIVNGQVIIVSSEEDLKIIERIFDEYENDVDEVNIIYPISVLLADHSSITIENENALDDLRELCTEEGEDDDIECIDFIYPVKITTYNTSTQVSQVITISDDSELHNFLEAMDEDELVSFTFPLVMLLADGTTLTINDNNELEEGIENSIDDCDEDDDNDFDDDDIDDSDLIAALLNGSWKVIYFFDDKDETSEFANYVFTFYADGTAIATNGIINQGGTWVTYGDDGELELLLNFGPDDPFDEIDEDWTVLEFTMSTIRLEDEKENEPSKKLTFEKL
ncbi:MAG: hypothetical protein OEU76_03225 [Cyclobacteriaceae bacterium]|nr:hypothetical protein [Cyclobacteriaceae bacterium]